MMPPNGPALGDGDGGGRRRRCRCRWGAASKPAGDRGGHRGKRVVVLNLRGRPLGRPSEFSPASGPSRGGASDERAVRGYGTVRFRARKKPREPSRRSAAPGEVA